MSSISGIGNFKLVYQNYQLIVDTNDYSINEYKSDKIEYRKDDQIQRPAFYKKGNRMYFDFDLLQKDKTNEEFDNIYVDLLKIAGKIVDFYPHIDNPNNKIECYFIPYMNKYNEYPIRYINMRFIDTALFGGIQTRKNPFYD